MKRTPEQTRDLILLNIYTTIPMKQWPIFAFVLGIQLAKAEPRLADALIETMATAKSEESKLASLAGIEQSIAELRDGTEF